MAGTERDTIVDSYRGLAIVLMVAANFLAGVHAVPAWLKHAPDIGLTAVDLIAPMFLLAMGLTYIPSVRKRREREGAQAAVGHALARYFAMAGIGALLAAGADLVGQSSARFSWGVLQAIGMAGVLLLPLVYTPWWTRLAAGLGTLAVYQILLDRYWLEQVLASSHGGILGCLAWFSLLCIATVVAPHLREPRWRGLSGPAASAALTGAGLALALLVPVSKNRVSASYVLISLGLCGLAYTALRAVLGGIKLRIRHLEAWGANPLGLYLLHEVLLAVVVLPGVPGWYVAAPPWLTAVQLGGLLGVLGGVARFLSRRGVVLRL